jgi:hypothetical protein
MDFVQYSWNELPASQHLPITWDFEIQVMQKDTLKNAWNIKQDHQLEVQNDAKLPYHDISWHTVDGRNPALVDRWFIPLFPPTVSYTRSKAEVVLCFSCKEKALLPIDVDATSHLLGDILKALVRRHFQRWSYIWESVPPCPTAYHCKAPWDTNQDTKQFSL